MTLRSSLYACMDAKCKDEGMRSLVVKERKRILVAHLSIQNRTYWQNVSFFCGGLAGW